MSRVGEGSALINLKNVRSKLQKYGLHLSKKFGQNFLVDKNVRDKIISAGNILPGDKIVEIGPGLGALTEEFLNLRAEVWAVEIDKGMYEALEDLFISDKLHLLHNDALKVNWPEVLDPLGGPYKLIANLPYNITGPLLFKLLEHKNLFSFFVIMVQKELAERLVAPPNCKSYGALTLQMSYHMDIKNLFPVSPNSFFPKPDVESAVLKLTPREKAPITVVDEEFMFTIIKEGFSQRRKTLLNNLKGLGIGRETIKIALEKCNLKEECRAEELTLNDFSCLANILLQLKGGAENVPTVFL